MLWVKRAKQEHDGFAESLRELGVRVLYFERLLRETLALPKAKDYVLDRVFDERVYGPVAVEPVRTLVAGLDGRDLTECLIGGLTKREALERMPDPRSVTFHAMDDDDFLLPPLPNHLFTRDTSCWIHDGVAINSMRKASRIRESVHYEAIYRWHPEFADADFHTWSEGTAGGLATMEGGDVHVIGRGAVLVGMSERTTPQAVERLALRLFAAGAAVEDRGPVHAEGTGVHAPRHGDDDGRPRDVHRVRRARDAPVVHDRAGRRRGRAEGERPPAGGHAPCHRERAGAGRASGCSPRPRTCGPPSASSGTTGATC